MNPPRVIFLLLGLPGLSLAQVCTGIEDDAERLACYDARNTASAPAPAEVEVQSAPATAETPASESAVPAAAETAAPETAAPAAAETPASESAVRAATETLASESAVPATAENPAPEAAAVATVAAEAPQEFGKKEPLDAPREYIEATIVEIAESANIHYLRLDNGQVWREVEDSRMRFKEGRKVTITEGVLSSYDLQMEGYNKIVKVRRVR